MAGRLLTVAQLMPACDTLYDIGADHGQLSASLLTMGRCRKAVLSDISAPSLKKAQRLFAQQGLEAEFHVGDGLDGLTPQIDDAVAICGMGASTVLHILRKPLPCPVVIQANIHIEYLREGLPNRGLVIQEECIAKEDRRFYVCMLAKPGLGEPETGFEGYIGKGLLKDPLFFEYMRWRKTVLERALAGGSPDELLKMQLSWVKEALQWESG